MMSPPASEPTLFRARTLVPIDAPTIHDAGMLVDAGVVRRVGSFDQLKPLGDTAVFDLGDVLVLPGFLNAHTHLQLSLIDRATMPEGRFIDWLLGISAQMKPHADRIEEHLHDAVVAGAKQCLRFGVTCVGDISWQTAIARRSLASTPLRAVSFGEALGLAASRPRFEAALSSATSIEFAGDRLSVGIAPHAPYTVDRAGFMQAVEMASRLNIPITTHLAEHPDEEQFLRSHRGMFREAWDALGLWAEGVDRFAGSPVEFAKAVGLLDAGGLLAHVNYLSDADLSLLAASRASVVFCPRTHAYFKHAPHRWRDMIHAGMNVCVGTDSCASSGDLNIVEDLRLLKRQSPDVSADRLFELITTRAARGLSLQHERGSIAAGMAADFVVFEVRSLDEILDSDVKCAGVWISGERVV
jgi:aminodeoxyfutalosine deaminase